MKKRLLSILLCLSLALYLFPVLAQAQQAETSYLALGDSISSGYLLPEGEAAFPQQVADARGGTLTNLAENGETTASLLAKLNQGTLDQALAGAQVITLTIGGNDLMNALYDFLTFQYNGANPSTPVTAQEMKEALTAGKLEMLTFALKVLPDFADSQQAVDALQPILAINGTLDERLSRLEALLKDSETGRLGVDELKFVISHTAALGLKAELDLDVSLARGLNYYTGTIIEVKALDVAIGSITGGGRYDNLTGVFGMPGLSGVGISFGADRIYDVLNTLDLYPKETEVASTVMFVNLGEAEAMESLKAIRRLRAKGISCEIYPDEAKMKKQFAYADALHIPYVAIIGESELAEGKITLKNMTDGTQCQYDAENLADGIL